MTLTRSTYAPSASSSAPPPLSEQGEALAWHESTPTRSRKGRTSFRVTRRHVPAAVVTDEPSGLCGASQIQLAQLATRILRHAGHNDLDLIGTTMVGYADVTPPLTYSARTCDHVIPAAPWMPTVDDCPSCDRYFGTVAQWEGASGDARGVARHRADLAGWSNALPRDFAARAETDETAGWPERTDVGRRDHRTGEDPTIVPVQGWEVNSASECVPAEMLGWTIERLVSYSTDPTRMFVGHSARDRSVTDHTSADDKPMTLAQAQTSEAVKVRTTLATRPTDPLVREQIEAAVLALAEGPTSLKLARGVLTLAGSGDRVACTMVTSDGSVTTWRARSPRAIAARIGA